MEQDNYTKALISRSAFIHTFITCFQGGRLSDPPLSGPPNIFLFNIADCAICIGAALLLFDAFTGESPKEHKA